jgi:hypothetical protein
MKQVRRTHHLSSHAVGEKSSESSVPLQPVSTQVHSSPQPHARRASSIKLTLPKP